MRVNQLRKYFHISISKKLLLFHTTSLVILLGVIVFSLRTVTRASVQLRDDLLVQVEMNDFFSKINVGMNRAFHRFELLSLSRASDIDGVIEELNVVRARVSEFSKVFNGVDEERAFMEGHFVQILKQEQRIRTSVFHYRSVVEEETGGDYASPIIREIREIVGEAVSEINEEQKVSEEHTYAAMLLIERSLSRAEAFLYQSLIGAFFLVCFVSYLSSKTITRFMNLAIYALIDISNGKFGSRINFNDNDKFGELAYGIDVMASRLEETDKDLKGAIKVAEEASVSKSDFLANMSHEIRTPMTAILGFTDLLCEAELSEKERSNHVKTIQKNGKHLLTIINDILDISKIEAGKMEVEKIDCSVIQIAHEVTSLVEARARGKNLFFNLEFSGKIPETIKSDPTRLRQILINLSGNAIKFTEMGGVRLVVRFNDHGGDDDTIQFEVVDTGIGLSDDQCGRLFQAFGQADTSTTRKFGGTGLGLAISKHLAVMLGGDIRIESELGRGSSFITTVLAGDLADVKFIENAMDHQEVEVEERSKKDSKKKLEGVRILLAEDGPDNQKLISFHLKRAGASVTVVEDGMAAYIAGMEALANEEMFDVILMDMQMPILDGYGSARKLRNNHYKGPIIALTAHAMASDRLKCLKAGCSEFETKPINPKGLVQTICDQIAGVAVADAVIGEIVGEDSLDETEGLGEGFDEDVSGGMAA